LLADEFADDTLDVSLQAAPMYQIVCIRSIPCLADGFAYDEARWAKSNRQAQEYWEDAKSSFQEAINLQPAATEVVHLLVHLLICAGRIQEVPQS
jgi:hypothetical protein